MKKSFKKITLIVPLLFLIAMPFSLAQDETGDETAASAPTAGFCQTEIVQFINSQTKDLAEFMTEHFQSGNQTSALLPDAMEKFREYAKSLKAKVKQASPPPGNAAAKIIDEYSACKRQADDALFLTKEVLKQHVLATAQAKKTTKLLDAFKQINSKLDKLHIQTAQLYANITTFSQKLPCYVESCN